MKNLWRFRSGIPKDATIELRSNSNTITTVSTDGTQKGHQKDRNLPGSDTTITDSMTQNLCTITDQIE